MGAERQHLSHLYLAGDSASLTCQNIIQQLSRFNFHRTPLEKGRTTGSGQVVKVLDLLPGVGDASTQEECAGMSSVMPCSNTCNPIISSADFVSTECVLLRQNLLWHCWFEVLLLASSSQQVHYLLGSPVRGI